METRRKLGLDLRNKIKSKIENKLGYIRWYKIKKIYREYKKYEKEISGVCIYLHLSGISFFCFYLNLLLKRYYYIIYCYIRML